MTYETWFYAKSAGESNLGRFFVHNNVDLFIQPSTILFQSNWSTAGNGQYHLVVLTPGTISQLVMILDQLPTPLRYILMA